MHGGYRYSEDLDFCVPVEKKAEALETLVHKAYLHAKNLLILYLGDAFFELKKKERKKILTWWFCVLPVGERQKYRVKMEFGLYPAYLKEAIPVGVKNKFLPRQPVVISIQAKELLADKLNAVADRPYVKERDFFDLWYLRTVLKVPVDLELFYRKLKDYSSKDPKTVLKKRLEELDTSHLARNMNLFLPARYRQIFAGNNYQDMIEVCRQTIQCILENL